MRIVDRFLLFRKRGNRINSKVENERAGNEQLSRRGVTLRHPIWFLIFILCLNPSLVGWSSPDQQGIIVRVGYYENPPKFFKDPDGNIEGFWPDLIHAIAVQEGWTVIWIPGTWEENLDKLESGKIDIMPDVAWNETRSQIYSFADTKVLVSWSRLYAGSGSNIETVLDLEGKIVAGLKGSVNYDGPEGIKDLVQQFDVSTAFVDLESYTEVFEAIQDGSVDAGITNKDFGNQNERNYSNLVRTSFVFQPTYITFAFPKDGELTPRLMETIDRHMEAYKSDSDSIYYQSLETYLEQGASETILEVDVFTTQEWYAILFGISIILILILNSYILRREVRRRTAELQDNQALLQGILESTPDAVFVKDPHGKYILFNEGAERSLGKPSRDVIGRDDYAVVPDLAQKIIEIDRKVIEEGETITYEETLPDANGEHRMYLTTKGPLYKKNNEILGVFGIARDITARKLAEDAVRSSEERYRGVAEDTPALLCSFRPGGIITYVNKSYCDYFNVKADEMIGKSFLHLVYESDQERVMANISALSPDSPTITIEQQTIDKSGEIRWQRWTNRGIFDAEGRVISYQAIGEDITVRKEVEDALQESEERLRLLMEHSPFGIQLFNMDGTLIQVNQTWEKMWGAKSEEVVGKYNAFKDPQLDALGMRSFVDEAFSHGNAGSVEIMYTPSESNFPGEPRWVRAFSYHIPDESGAASHLVLLNEDITDRKKAEEAVRTAEENYRSVIENAPVGIFRSTPDGRVLLVNPTLAQMYGFNSPDEMLDKIKDISSQLYVNKSARNEFVNLLTDKGEVYNFEEQNYRKDGSIIWVSTNARTVINPLGDLLYFEGFVRDITESKQAEKILLEAELKYRTLVEQIPNAATYIDSADPSVGTIYISPQIEEILGYTTEEWMSSPTVWHDHIHPDDREKVLALDNQHDKTGETIEMDYRLLAKNGNVVWISDRATMLLDEKGKPIYSHGIMVDITELKQAEAAIRDSEEKFKIAFQTHPDSINITRLSDNKIVEVNDGFPIITGYTKEEAIGRNAESFGFWANIENRKKMIESVKENGRADNIEYLRKMKDGKTRYTTLSATLITLNDEPHLLCIIKDIHDRKLAEKELKEAHDLLEQRVKERTLELTHANRAKDEFLATMSHELRTPLNSILGFSESLLEQRRGPLNEKQEQYVQLVHSSGQHLLGLINDILEVSKIEAGKLEIYPDIVSVKEICESSLNFVRELASKKSISLDLQTDPALQTLRADPQRMKQIVINLLSNAVKFTSQNGSVRLEVALNSEKDQIQFSVTDNGIGISQDDLAKLFTPFTQLDSSMSRNNEGTGLGLVLVSKLTDLHGGSVVVESEPNKGSRFTVTLPWSGNDNGNENQKPSVDGKSAGSSSSSSIDHGRILLAEDNESNILTVSDYLVGRGFQVVVARNGLDAIRRAEESHPDIILMDIQMPQLDGLEAIRRLRAKPEFSSVPIIAITALAMPGDRERCFEAGANEYISKPVSLKMLKKIIDNLLQTRNE